MKFSWRRAIAIGRKEVFHILRDPFTLATALGLPVFMVVMFGSAIEFNVKNIDLAISDSDQTSASRRLMDTFQSSGYFKIHRVVSPNEALVNLTTETARASVIIPPNFEKDLTSDRGSQVQCLLDGSDSSTVAPVLGYLGKIQSISNDRIAAFNPTSPIELRTRFLFNPELNSKWFVIPGLNVIIMSMLSILLTALTVAREWENGSMELLLTTPVEPLEIIIGKLAPYGVLGITAMVFVYIIARAVFGVPFVGSLVVYGLGSLIFLMTYLSQGLLISVVTRNQQVAMQIAMMSGMLPSQLLSGFVFPIESMPIFFQKFTMIFPARWFMQISRDTFLKGSRMVDLGIPFLALIATCLLMMTLSTRIFKKDLEK